MASDDVENLKAAARELGEGAGDGADRWLLLTAAGYLAGDAGEPTLPAGMTAAELVRGAKVARSVGGEGLAVRSALEEALARGAALLDAGRSGPTGDEYARYLSFLSHDLRGGLNGILLMVEVLKRQLAGRDEFKEQVEDLDVMRRGVLDTVSLMDRFIYGERFKRGLVKVRPSRVDFGLLAEQIHLQFAADAAEDHRSFTAKGDGRAETDRALIMLIAVGLAGNAIKHCKGSPVHVEMSGKGGDSWSLCVKDGGKGLPAEVRRSLEAPLTGAPEEVKGLGLIRMAVEALGASFKFESGAEGCLFEVEHP